MKRFKIIPFLAPVPDPIPLTGQPYVPSPEAERQAEVYFKARWKYLYVDEHVSVSTQPMWWGHAHLENNVFTCAGENVMQYFLTETGEPTAIKVEPCR